MLKVLQQSEARVLAGSGLAELGDPTKREVVVDILTEDATEVRPGAAVQRRKRLHRPQLAGWLSTPKLLADHLGAVKERLARV